MRLKDSKPAFSAFSVSDPVRFMHGGKSVQGHIARKTPRRAQVVAPDGSEYQVPWRLLMRNEGGRKKSVNLRIDALKTRFRPDDKVSFPFESGRLRGVIARLGPKRALVACAGGKDYRVPYALLEPVALDSGRVDRKRLAEVSRMAEELIHRHGLAGWSFQFNDASRQAGRCAYDIQVISLSRLFCLEAPADEVRDTILHDRVSGLPMRSSAPSTITTRSGMRRPDRSAAPGTAVMTSISLRPATSFPVPAAVGVGKPISAGRGSSARLVRSRSRIRPIRGRLGAEWATQGVAPRPETDLDHERGDPSPGFRLGATKNARPIAWWKSCS